MGFFEHAYYLLDVRDAKKFGAAARLFNQGRIGISDLQCERDGSSNFLSTMFASL